MEIEETLFGLVVAAQDQQKAVENALVSLAKERNALSNVVSQLDAQRSKLAASAGDDAAAAAVHQSLGKSPLAATQALQKSTNALTDAAVTVYGAARWIGLKVILLCLALGSGSVTALW